MMTITNVTDKEIALAAELRAMEARKDAAYLERNQLVALLSKLFPAGKRKTAIEGWSEDWHGCVYIDLPTGQASWHYHDSQAHLFDHLPEYQGAYDGHTTEQKYQHIAGYVEPGPIDLKDNEQYRMQMVGISTAALGYWKEGDSIHPDYDTLALRDVAKLYAKYDALFNMRVEFNRAINFAITLGLDASDFLRAWREGDTSDWPEYSANGIGG